MKAYSLDLRQKIIETYQAGGITQRDLAVRFRVSIFFVVKLLRLERTGQRLEAKRRGGQVKPKLTPEMREFLRAEIAGQNDLTLQELAALVQQRFGVIASLATVCRARAGNGVAAQKKTVFATERLSERVRELRIQWQRDKQPALAKRQVWFLDETGVSLRLARNYGRAFRGARVLGNVPKNYGESVTVLGAMTGSGKMAAMEVRGATDQAVMVSFINQVLSTQVSPGDVVVLENLAAHKTAKVQAAFAAVGVEAWYLPPYSPELNPIEMCWSKFKTSLRARAARTYEALSEAVSAALLTITATDAQNWVKHCGYV